MKNLTDKYKMIAEDAASMFGRFDAGEGVFARNLVTATIQELFRFEYPETKWASGEMIDWVQGASDGASEIGYLQTGSVGGGEPGASAIVSHYATDIPEVDLNGDYHLTRVHTVACSFSYSTQEVRAARFQNLFDIAQEKARSAKEKHDRDINALIAFGSSAHGLEGVTNGTGISVLPAITGNWATATPDQIRADFAEAYQSMIDATGGVEKPNMAVVSPGILARLRSLLNSANASNISLKDYLEAAYEVTFHAEQTMTQAGPGSSNAMLLYRKDPQRVRVAMPLFLSPLPIQPVGLAFKCPMESRFGGVILPRPLSILRLDGI